MTDTPRQFRKRKLFALSLGAALTASTLLGGAAGAYITQEVTQNRAADTSGPATSNLHRTAFRTTSSVALADMVEDVSPAVVQVKAQQSGPAFTRSSAEGPFGDLFEGFMGEPLPRQRAPQAEAMGSGFVIDAKGLVVTNAHVVDGVREVSVKLSDGRELPATVVGRDAKTDLAVLHIKGGGRFPTVQWGDSDQVRVGEDVVAVGSPFGLGNTVTKGIVSGRGRAIGAGPYDDFLQIDAPINSGNSGGPLFDATGRVVGINTAIYSPSGGNVGIGFAIPSSMAREVVDQLAAKGSVSRGQLGVAIQEVTPEIADSLGLANTKGALVTDVAPGSPAEHAGLRAGDVVRSFGGAALSGPPDLSRAVAKARIGDTVPLIVLRDGRTLTVPVRVAGAEVVRPDVGDDARQRTAQADTPRLGIQVAPAGPQLNEEAGQPRNARGVMVMAVDPYGRAAGRGLAPGDVILAVNTTRVETPDVLAAEVQEAARSGRKHVLLEVVRSGERSLVTVPLA